MANAEPPSAPTTAQIADAAEAAETVDGKHFQDAADHAWNWFTLHSGQRMQMINFLIIALTLTTAAYATAMSQKKFGVACGIALGGVLLAALFQRLDVRTRELVQACEPALKHIEARLSRESGIDVNFVEAIEKPAKRRTTYRFTLRVLTCAAMAFFSLGAGYAVYKSASQ
jgi:hypothetical protein